MTRERARELTPIIKAWGEGKEVEWTWDHSNEEWHSVCAPNFADIGLRWRIKPMAREWHICLACAASQQLPLELIHKTYCCKAIAQVVRVREVLDAPASGVTTD